MVLPTLYLRDLISKTLLAHHQLEYNESLSDFEGIYYNTIQYRKLFLHQHGKDAYYHWDLESSLLLQKADSNYVSFHQ